MAEFSSGFKLWADSSAFDREMAKASRSAEAAGRSITRAFDAKNIGTTLATALGLNLQSIAEKLVEPFKQSAESAQRIAEYTERAMAATLKLIDLRKTDAQLLADMERKFAKMQADNSSPGVGWAEKLMLNLIYGPLLARGMIKDREQEVATEAGAKKSAELNELGLRIDEKRRDIAKKAEQDRKKADDEAFKMAQADFQEEKKKGDAVRDLAAFEREQRREKMTTAERVVDLREEEAQLTKRILEYEKFGVEHLTDSGVEELLDLKKQLADTQERIAQLTAKTAEKEEEVAKAVEKVVALKRFGREDAELSDRELQRKRMELEADIEARRGRALSMPAAIGGGGDGGYDPLLYYQRNELANLTRQIDLRNETRRNVALFGEDRAFQMSRLSESEFRSILNMSTAIDKQTDYLRQIVDHQRNPKSVTPVVVVGGGGT